MPKKKQEKIEETKEQEKEMEREEEVNEQKQEKKEETTGKKMEGQEEKAEEQEEVEEKKLSKEERPGIAYIYTSSNNTLIHITDLSGNTISRISGGMVTKQSRLKSSPTIAMFVAKKASERPKDLGITSLYVRIRSKTGSPNLGPGGHAAVKSLSKEGFRIINVLDTTRVPRGGPKAKGGKRGRRV